MNFLYLHAALFSLIGGSGIILGALAASHEHIRPRWLENEFRHTVTAFGGGALLSAVALVLVPEGIKDQSALSFALTFLGGGVCFLSLERYLASRKTMVSQLIAMMLDFVPEAIVIGAVITENYFQALLVAIIIFVQNTPESFNAFCEIKKTAKAATGKLLLWFLAISCTGPIYVAIGTRLLHKHPHWISLLMTFCAGGILYIVFNDVAPQAKLRRHWWPAMGALLGFSIGVVGQILMP